MSGDISEEVEVVDTFDVVLKHPKTGEDMVEGGTRSIDPDTGAEKVEGGLVKSVTVYGPGSLPYRAAQQRQNNRAVLRYKQKRDEPVSDAENAENTAIFLADCTASFNNFNYKGLEGTAGFKACYADPKMGWLTDLVNAKMGDWGNFTKAAKGS